MWWNMFMAFGTILSRNWIRDLTTMTKSFKIILTTSGGNKLEIETTEIPDYQCHTFITLRTVTRFKHTLFVRPLIFILILYIYTLYWILYISDYVDKHIPVWKNFFSTSLWVLSGGYSSTSSTYKLHLLSHCSNCIVIYSYIVGHNSFTRKQEGPENKLH